MNEAEMMRKCTAKSTAMCRYRVESRKRAHFSFLFCSLTFTSDEQDSHVEDTSRTVRARTVAYRLTYTQMKAFIFVFDSFLMLGDESCLPKKSFLFAGCMSCLKVVTT